MLEVLLGKHVISVLHYSKTHCSGFASMSRIPKSALGLDIVCFRIVSFLFGGNTEPVRQRVDEDRQPSLSLHATTNQNWLLGNTRSCSSAPKSLLCLLIFGNIWAPVACVLFFCLRTNLSMSVCMLSSLLLDLLPSRHFQS